MSSAKRAAELGLTGDQTVVYIISSITAKADFAIERSRP